MSDSIRITVLVENSVNRGGLKAEHGWSCLIEIGGRRILFDTGQTEMLLENAKVLGCALENLDAIVLSHGHYDHTGGLAAVCRLSPTARVFAHPAALESKFTRDADGSARQIGMPEAGKRAIVNAGSRFIPTQVCQAVAAGLLVTGEIPRQTDFEDVGGCFVHDERCRQPDLLVDDQAVFFDTSKGLVVLLGCAHAGVVNTLTHIGRLTGGKSVHAVLGGMHLLNASPARLAATMEALGQRDIALLVSAHCSGSAAVARLWQCFPGRCAGASVGSQFVFGK